MRAVVLREHGGPEVLRVEELPDPHAGPGEVRVRVAAVAMNHVDVWVRKGLPHLKLHYPFLLGADVAGTVDEVGPGVSGVAAGDEIVVNPGHSCGRCRDCLSGQDNLCRWFQLLGEDRPGGYGELLLVPATNVVAKPKALSMEQAAAAPVTFLTAWQMLTRKARVTPGMEVLVIAAGSGVGSAAVQIAKLHGARVIATAGSDEKLKLARKLGADETINHSTADLVAEVKRLTGRRGVDVVFEHVGGEVSSPKDDLVRGQGGRHRHLRRHRRLHAAGGSAPRVFSSASDPGIDHGAEGRPVSAARSPGGRPAPSGDRPGDALVGSGRCASLASSPGLPFGKIVLRPN